MRGSHRNRCWDDERGLPSEMFLFIKGEGRCRGAAGFIGQFAFTRTPAQITRALIRLPKWGVLPTSYQTSLCLCSTGFFARYLFWRAISKTWPFLPKKCFTVIRPAILIFRSIKTGLWTFSKKAFNILICLLYVTLYYFQRFQRFCEEQRGKYSRSQLHFWYSTCFNLFVNDIHSYEMEK